MQNIALIFGGESTEREVSIITASQIEKMCDRKKYNLFCVLINENGKMLWCKKGICEKECAKKVLDPKKYVEVCFCGGEIHEVKKSKTKNLSKIDCAIIACHGGRGENGELVSYLNFAGIKTSVGGPEGLAIAMDKCLCKCVLEKGGVNALPGFFVTKSEWDENREAVLKQIADFNYPVVVKPARQGSSIGISFVKNEKNIEEAIELAIMFDEKILIEKGLDDFCELNASVMWDGKNEPQVSEIEEPVRSGAILSFEDKYFGSQKTKNNIIKSAKLCNFGQKLAKNGTKICNFGQNSMANSYRKFPAEINENTKSIISAYAKKVVKLLELTGVVRIDFLERNGEIYVNEVNSVPGSLAFYFWGENGFFDSLVEIALSKNSENKSDLIARFL